MAPAFDILETKATLLAENSEAAEALRSRLKAKGIFFVNVMGSPGAGKTSVLLRLIEALREDYAIGVLEADADGDVDARIMANAGVPVLQVHTGGSCHMDAAMTAAALERLKPSCNLIFLENVGNMVCPAEFDVGASLSLMILSAPEGHDKPQKYPLMFEVADCILVNKMDAAEIFGFSMDEFLENLRRRNEKAPVFPVSAAAGTGFDPFLSLLKEQIKEAKVF